MPCLSLTLCLGRLTDLAPIIFAFYHLFAYSKSAKNKDESDMNACRFAHMRIQTLDFMNIEAFIWLKAL